MKRLTVVLAVLGCGCMDEKMGPGEATPIQRTAVPVPAPGRPPGLKPATLVAAPLAEPVAESPKGPTVPAGLTRVKMGDLLEFSWSRTGEANVDQAAAMAIVMGNRGAPNIEGAKNLPPPKNTVKTGTLTLVRVEPEKPFTFRVEVKSGKNTEQLLYTYGPDVAIDRVLFRTDPEDPKKKAKAAGTIWDCVETPTRLIAPGAASLALSGGLVSETSPEATRVGSVSVALTRVGSTKSAATGEKAKVLDTFEPPIAIAMQQVQRFGVVDPEAKAAHDGAINAQIAAAAAGCLTGLKPSHGTLEGVIVGGKVESLLWEKKPAPKAFDKCVRAGMKKLKLPADETFINVPLGKGT